MKKILYINIAAILAFASCAKVNEPGNGDGESRLVFKVKTDLGVNHVTPTRADGDRTYLVDLDGPEVRNFELTSPTVSVKPGIYGVKVTSPASYTMPDFGVPVFQGATSVEVPEGGSATAGITCYQINTGVRFVFDQSVRDFYEALSVKIEDNADASKNLSYGYADETADKTAYFEPGILKLSLTDGDTPIKIVGQESSTITVAAKEVWTITLKTANRITGEIEINIEVDTDTEDREGNWGIGDVEGAGTYASPYSVTSAINAMPVENVWVEGYIVGTTTVTTTRSGANAVLIGARSNADESKCIVFEISGSDQFAQLADEAAVGKKVKLWGDVAAKSTAFTSGARAVISNVVDFDGEARNTGADTAEAIALSGKTMKDIATEYPYFRMGATVKTDNMFPGSKLITGPYINLIYRDFNSMTMEYEMKMAKQVSLNGGAEDWRTNRINMFMDFAPENNMAVHGHTLVWYKDVPSDWIWGKDAEATDWDNEGLTTADKEGIKAKLTEFIEFTMLKYRYARSWDVVNEAINNSNGGFRKCIWNTVYGGGEEYVREVFKIARRVVKENNLDCKLFYNDYQTELQPSKRQAIEDFVNKLNSEYAAENDGEFLIDGIGLQMHLKAGSDRKGLVAAVESAVSTGCLVHISELSVSLTDTSNITQEQLDKQNQTFNDIFDVAFDLIPKDKFWGVTFWGVNDYYTVYNTVQGMIYDAESHAKRAYFDVIRKHGN